MSLKNEFQDHYYPPQEWSAKGIGWELTKEDWVTFKQ